MKDYLKKYLYYYHFDPSNSLLRALEAKLMSNLKLEGPILDLGCGDGNFTSVLLSNSNVIGADFSLKKIIKSKKKNFYSDLIVCKAQKLPVKNNIFNTLLMNCFLEHIKEESVENVISEVNRVLNIGGRSYITVNSNEFGYFDPVNIYCKNVKIKFLSQLWQIYKNKRLALYSLKDYSYWKELFNKTGFRIVDSKKYLTSQTEKKFFLWTELQYIGISRINLGSIIRLYSKILDFLGIKWHRKIVANVFSRILKKYYVEEEGKNQGSCIFFVLEKEKDISLQHIKQKDDLSVDECIAFSKEPEVSVIIPSLDGYRGGNLAKLIQDLKKQNYQDFAIHVIKGVNPQGRAINMGASKAMGEILIILDDDSRIDNPNIIGNLVKVIKEKSIGMVGASIIPPPDANWLQQRAGEEFPRFSMEIVKDITESDMPCHGCCAFRKEVFKEVGMERESILRGLDPDLRVRLRNAGYRIVLAPDSWVYHPLPPTLIKLIKTFFRNGIGSAYAQRYQPGLIYDTDETLELKDFKPKRSFIYRIVRFPLRLIKSLATFKFLRFIAYTVYAVGYWYGYIKYSIK